MLPLADWATFFAYLLFTALATAWLAHRPRRRTLSTNTYYDVEYQNSDTGDPFLGDGGRSPMFLAVGLVSGLTSGISVLGTPAYTYLHGPGLLLGAAATVAGLPIVTQLLVPAFKRDSDQHESPSLYRYLETRFSGAVRKVASALFVLRTLFYLAVVLYAPAVALASVFNVPTAALSTGCGVLATAVAFKGGIEAVAIVDFLQSLPLIACTLALVFYVGLRAAPVTVSLPDGYMLPTDLQQDCGVYMLVGSLFASVAQTGADQVAVQRYFLTNNPSDSAWSAAIATFLSALFQALLCLLGTFLVPFLQHRPFADADQLLPYTLQHHFPAGVTGLFLAAVVGCTVSVASAAINAASACLREDFGLFSNNPPYSSARKLAVVLGFLATALSIAASFLDHSLIVMSNAALGLTLGPTLGIFLLAVTTNAEDDDAKAAYAVGITCMGVLAYDQLTPDPHVNVFLVTPFLTTITYVFGLLLSWFPRYLG